METIIGWVKDFIVPVTAVVSLVLTEVIKRAVNSETFNKRWLPAVAGGIGVGFHISLTGHFDAQTLAAGLVSGVAASGIWDMIDKGK